MIVQWLLASLHLLALGMGLPAVWARGQALRGRLDEDGLRRVFLADTMVFAATAMARGYGA